jgi:hypothetical protein
MSVCVLKPHADSTTTSGLPWNSRLQSTDITIPDGLVTLVRLSSQINEAMFEGAGTRFHLLSSICVSTITISSCEEDLDYAQTTSPLNRNSTTCPALGPRSYTPFVRVASDSSKNILVRTFSQPIIDNLANKSIQNIIFAVRLSCLPERL